MLAPAVLDADTATFRFKLDGETLEYQESFDPYMYTTSYLRQTIRDEDLHTVLILPYGPLEVPFPLGVGVDRHLRPPTSTDWWDVVQGHCPGFVPYSLQGFIAKGNVHRPTPSIGSL